MVGPDFDVEVHPPATRIAIAMDKSLAMDLITGTSLFPIDYRPTPPPPHRITPQHLRIHGGVVFRYSDGGALLLKRYAAGE
jgi:hypothetical protein